MSSYHVDTRQTDEYDEFGHAWECNSEDCHKWDCEQNGNGTSEVQRIIRVDSETSE